MLAAREAAGSTARAPAVRMIAAVRLALRATKLAVAFALCVTASIACGQIYKCQDPSGKTIYADAPCPSGGKTLKLPDDAKSSVTGPTVCAQLLDETRRLAAEADHDAKRGRPVNVTSAKRRKALVTQYERRCAGIARSRP